VVDGVVGVIIWTADLERLSAFYRDTLGLEPHSVQPRFVSFKWGDVKLGIGAHDRVSGPARDPYRIMVNLGVQDIHAAYRTLVERGVRFLRAPEREHWGGWVATFADPDGNVLQLLQLREAGDG